MTSRDERWVALYDRLRRLLAGFGKNDAFGEGDYWLVDDDWAGRHQKICITNPRFWSLTIQERVRQLLEDGFDDWGVYIVFEDESNRAAFIIYNNGVSDSPRWE